MKTKFFIIFIVFIVLLVGGLGMFLNRNTNGPSKYEGLAQALKSQGAEFYGSFWCPHCQEQKAEFGSASKYLPYIECSNVDNTTKQICIDKKIEGFPTWKFKDGITITSSQDPIICEIKTDTSTESAACVNRSSKYYKTWLFPSNDFSIKSPTDPIKEGIVWKFSPEAEASGKMSIASLAEQIKFVLP